MSKKTEKNFEKLAARLFGTLKKDQLPGFRQVLKALEIAKGEKFVITAEQVDRLHKVITPGEDDDDLENFCDDVCILCDVWDDVCLECDEDDWGCGQIGDVCITCDEGD